MLRAPDRETARSDAVLAVSLSALLLAGANSGLTILRINPHYRTEYVAAVLNMALLTGVLWGAAGVARRLCRGPWTYRGAVAAWLLLAALAAYTIVHVVVPGRPLLSLLTFGDRLRSGQPVLLALGLLAGLGLWRWPAAVAACLAAVLRITAPYAVVVGAQLVWTGAAANPQPVAEPQPADGLQPVRDHRVVLLLFDELQQHYVFDARPADLHLPAFDRLLGESVAAPAVPAGPNTFVAVPTMLTGRPVRSSAWHRDGDLEVEFADRPGVERLSRMDSLLTEAARSESSPLVIGHPAMYRLLHGRGVRFREIMHPTEPPGVLESLSRQWRANVIPALPFAIPLHLAGRLWRPVDNLRYVYAFEQSRDVLTRTLTIGDFGLLWTHLLTPHGPAIWDRRGSCYTTALRPDPYSLDDYLSMVSFTDQMLGDCRAALENGGLWAQTTVVVTADHWFRESPALPGGRRDERIPLIVHLAGQTSAVRLTQPVSNRAFHDLTLALLRRELTTPQQLVTWLAHHAVPTVAETPDATR